MSAAIVGDSGIALESASNISILRSTEDGGLCAEQADFQLLHLRNVHDQSEYDDLAGRLALNARVEEVLGHCPIPVDECQSA